MMTDFIIRISVAAMLGGIIGLDRGYRAKDAGFRTHFLVALGSSLFMILSKYGFNDILTGNNVSLDPSRIASQVVTGIGFIGAGTIIFQKQMVRGLTTAAGLWVTSAIGLTCGAGMYVLAAIATVLSLISLEAFNFFLNRFSVRNVSIRFSASSRDEIRDAMAIIEKSDIEIETYNLSEHTDQNGSRYIASLTVRVRRDSYVTRLMDIMREFKGITIDDIE